MRRSNRTIFRGALRVAVLVAMSVPMQPLLANTSLDSGTTTVSTGTSFGQLLYVGDSGTATMNVIAGGYATNSSGFIGYRFPESKGTVTVSSGTWANSNFLQIGNFGTGTLNVSGGSVTNRDGYIGSAAGGVGMVTVSSGTWSNNGNLAVGSSGTGTLTMTGGRVIVSGSLSKNAASTINLNAGGTLQIGAGSTGGVLLGGTGSLVNNGALVFNRSNASIYSGVISGTGAVTKQGAGTLALSNNNSYTGGTTIIAGTVTIPAGGSISHDSAGLIIGQVSGESGTLNVTGGIVTNGASIIGNNLFSIGTVTVSSGTWATTYDLAVGYGVSSIGTLNVSGGSVTNGGQGIIGEDGSNGTVTVSSGTWVNSGDLKVGVNDGTGTLTMNGGLVSVAGTLSEGTYGTINLNAGGTLQIGVGSTEGVLLGGTGSLVNNGTLVFDRSNDSFYSGVISGAGVLKKQGAGTLTLDGNNSFTGGTTIVAGTITIPAGGSISHDSASMTIGQSSGDSGTLNVNGGNVTNGIGYLGQLAGSIGTAKVSSGTWANSGDLYVGLSGTGTLTMSGGLVTVGGTLSKGTDGAINLNAGGTLQIGTGGTTGVLGVGALTNNGTLIFNRSDASTYAGIISGTGTIQNAGMGTTTLTGQTSYTVPLVATAGRLIVGSNASVNGFSTAGSLAAASGATLELKSRGLAYVNGLSTLTGGTIRAANGISLGAGANVVGTGGVSGFVSAAYGSRVEADGGKLTVGDSSSYVGFASAGLLYTNANEVELLDRNLAVLGSLTQLGDGSAGGTLRAANGMLLEQGKNLVGRGTVHGNFVNQGDVYGDGSTAGQKIVFAAGSTVSGIGSFENVVFDGTYSPGNSPAITNLSNGEFSSASSLLIELGGTQPGTQYDRVVDSGVLTLLGGTLNVALYNGFVPSYGNSFEILQYGQLSGDFGSVNYPALSGGLSWQRTTSATAMTITVVPEPSTYAISAIATAGLAGLMRWRKRRSSESAV